MAATGSTAVVVVTSEFEQLAHTMAANAGRAGMRVLALPYPLESRSEPDVRSIARQHWPALLGALGALGAVGAPRVLGVDDA